LAGATTVVLPLPMRLASIDEFVEQTRLRIQHADVSLLLIDAEFAPFVPPADMPPMLTFAELTVGDAASFVVVEPPVDSLAVLQFTSGSTADPKGVMLPHRTVCANLDAIAVAADLVGRRRRDDLVAAAVSRHGLVGFLILPMSNGVELVLGAPQDFLGDPARWMRWMSTYRGTGHCWAQLRVGVGDTRVGPQRDARPFADAHRVERRRACRLRGSPTLRRRRGTARAATGRGVSRVRNGRARDRRYVP
jgi:acyl-CoA synthetase (AMP-forming)/AMP-acid ligase II